MVGEMFLCALTNISHYDIHIYTLHSRYVRTNDQHMLNLEWRFGYRDGAPYFENARIHVGIVFMEMPVASTHIHTHTHTHPDKREYRDMAVYAPMGRGLF